MDRFYVGSVVVFWIIWLPMTAVATVIAVSDFHVLWLLWLPIGFAGALLIPYFLYQARKPQIIEATPDSLIVRGTGEPFVRTVVIPREEVIRLRFGHVRGEDEYEMVATLNILTEGPWWKRRILIAPLVHPREKREIFRDLRAFLSGNGFRVEIEDTHSRSRSEQDGPPGG